MDKRTLHLKNEIGKRYGRWVVLARGTDVIYNGDRPRKTTVWRCRCECGTERDVKGGSLRSGISVSCGCYRNECLRKPADVVLCNRVANGIKQSARTRKIAYHLTPEQVRSLVLQNCHYCGASPSPANGVDRQDSDKPYIFENCVPACWPCNLMKNEFSEDEFLDQCRKIIQHVEQRT